MPYKMCSQVTSLPGEEIVNTPPRGQKSAATPSLSGQARDFFVLFFVCSLRVSSIVAQNKREKRRKLTKTPASLVEEQNVETCQTTEPALGVSATGQTPREAVAWTREISALYHNSRYLGTRNYICRAYHRTAVV